MVNRTIAPPVRKISEVRVAEAIESDLGGQVPVYYIDAGEQQVVKLEWISRAGTRFESIPGASFFSSKMIMEGTPSHTAGEIAENFDFLGAQIETSPGFDFSSVTIHSLRKNLTKILPLLKEMLFDSTLPEKGLELRKSLKRESLRVDLEKNAFLASRKIREAIFGRHHPYGLSLEISDIDNIPLGDVRDFYINCSSNDPVLIASGKIKSEDLQLIHETFRDIKLVNKSLGPDDYQITQERQLVIKKPDSLQSSIRIGKLALPKNHPDYIGLLIVNEILGGYFGSRLMKNIREEKGFTYGIYSNIMNLQHASLQLIGTDVKKINTEAAIEEIFKEIRLLQTEPVPDHELETVKNYMQGSFLSSINTSFSLADKFKSIFFHGLDYSFYSDYVKGINRITPDRVIELANKHLTIEDYSVVVVGGVE